MQLTLENSALKELIAKDHYENDDVIDIFNAAISTKFYIPINTDSSVSVNITEGKEDTIRDFKKMSLPCLKYENGVSYLPVFTDGEEYVKYADGRETYRPCIISFDALATLIDSEQSFDGFILDPLGNSLPFTRNTLDLIHQLIEGSK